MAHNFNKVYAPFGRLNPKDKLCSIEKPTKSWVKMFFDNDVPMYASEKIDGTSIGIVWDGERISFVGHTEGKPIAKELMPFLEENFGTKQFESVVEETFGESEVTIYGEMVHKNVGRHQYGHPEGFFIGYDICNNKTGKYYNRQAVFDILGKLGIQMPHEEIISMKTAIEVVKDKNRKSDFDPNEPLEGLVVRPLVEMYLNTNERIIAKIKVCDWAE